MPIWLGCLCGREFVIRDKMRGQVGTCPKCGRRVVAIDDPDKPTADREKAEPEEQERSVTSFSLKS